MRVRLNGWQRVGVVLSVIWVAIGWVLGNAALMDEASFEYRQVPIKAEINDTVSVVRVFGTGGGLK